MKQSLPLLPAAAGVIANGLCADPSVTPAGNLPPAGIARTVSQKDTLLQASP